MSNNQLQKLNLGTVQIRGETVDLTSSEGMGLVNAFAREEEGVLTMDFIKRKYDFADDDLAALAANNELIRAIFLAKAQRIFDGSAARDAAAFHVAITGVHRLGHILQDPLESTKNKIESYKALEKTAAAGGPADMAHREHVTVNIITSMDKPPTVIEINPSKELPAPDEQLQPITIIGRDPEPTDGAEASRLSE